MIESLTKENFFDELYKKYPDGMDQFYKWIDEQKEKIKWRVIFNSGSPQYANQGWHDPKFHDLPFVFQIGLIIQYFNEVLSGNECGDVLQRWTGAQKDMFVRTIEMEQLRLSKK